MTTITLKNIPDELHRRLRQRARQNRRSLNSEILALLESQVMPQKPDAEALLRRLKALQADMPTVEHRLVDEFRREGRP